VGEAGRAGSTTSSFARPLPLPFPLKVEVIVGATSGRGIDEALPFPFIAALAFLIAAAGGPEGEGGTEGLKTR